MKREERLIFSLNGRTIEAEAKVCDKALEKMIGKMFSRDKKPLLFVYQQEQKITIHMLFVFIPLFVVWLDANKKPVKIKNMKPFISFSCAKAKYVLEIPINI